MADDIKEKLEKRTEERLLELERKRLERSRQTKHEEEPEYLVSNFTRETLMIRESLRGLNDLQQNTLRERLDDATKHVQKLQKFLTDSYAFLPSYVAKNMQAEIIKLHEELNDKRSSLMPKKRFGFSKKKVKVDNENTTRNSGQDLEKNKVTKTFKEKEMVYGQNVTKIEEELTKKDVSLSNMKECTFHFYGSPLALHLEKLECCKVFCGPVCGSVFINKCKDCVFVFPCQQLRIHNTTSCHFYVHVTSRAIIEDSSDLGFAQFNWNYENIAKHFQSSGLDCMKNNWHCVDDFNWLNTEEQSPNWFIIAEGDRVTSWE